MTYADLVNALQKASYAWVHHLSVDQFDQASVWKARVDAIAGLLCAQRSTTSSAA